MQSCDQILSVAHDMFGETRFLGAERFQVSGVEQKQVSDVRMHLHANGPGDEVGDVMDLPRRRHSVFANGFGGGRVFQRQAEICGIRIGDL
jgi:hypothetical protein